MKLNKFFKLTIGTLIAIPVTAFLSGGILANHMHEEFEYELTNNDLLACGGGGGGSSPSAKAAKKMKQTKAKLSFKKRKLSKMAAAGESTAQLEAEIAELEAQLLE